MSNMDVYDSQAGLRIAMFGQKRIPSREGGIEIVVEELATRMVNRGYSVTCFNRKGHNVAGAEFDTEKLHEYKGVKLVEVFTVNRRGFAAMTSSILASIQTAFGKFDVVHIHAEGPAFMCWLPKLLRKRVVVTVHGLDHQRAKWGKMASWYIRSGEKNAVKYADEIIVLSKGVQDYFLRTYRRKTRFIPNGVNEPIVKNADLITQKWGLKKDSYILYLGRIVPEKGEKYLIDAFKQIKTDKKLVIAGGSSDTQLFMEELKDMARDDERILFTGFVQGTLLEELYSNAYIYTLPSDLEGMPLSLLEAMSYGNCCVTSDIPECAEVVENKAVLFKKGDSRDLQMKLQWLCDCSEVVESYKKNARSFITGKYNWNCVTEETLDLYHNREEKVKVETYAY